MPRTILIGLDGSASGAAAIDFALSLAQRHGSQLTGMAVVDDPAIRHAEPVPLGAASFKEHRDETLATEAHAQARQRLAAFAARCSEAGVVARLLETAGQPAEQMALEAQRHDLIVLGQHAHFHFGDPEQPDDTLKNVIRHAPRPVLIVPQQPRKGTTILVGYDGSLQAARTLQSFLAAGLHGSQRVHVVSVGADLLEVERRAERAIDYLRQHGVPAQPHAVATTNAPAEVILTRARQLDAEMLVIGAYGQPKLKEFIFGSTTQKLLDHSPVPVFLFH